MYVFILTAELVNNLCGDQAGSGGTLGTCDVWQSGQRKSCTDKIRRWLREGIQGSHLLPLVGRIDISTVTIGLKYSEACVTALQSDRTVTISGHAVHESPVDTPVHQTKVLLDTFTPPTKTTRSGETSQRSATMTAVASLQSQSGNSDACFVWSMGDGEQLHPHDGRTGLGLDGSCLTGVYLLFLLLVTLYSLGT